MGLRRGPGREGRSRAGAWPHTHPGRARQRLLVQGGGQDVLAVRRELHEGHGGVVVICMEHRRGCRGALTAGGAPPPPPSEATATRAHAATTHHSCSVRAAPPRDPRAGELQEQRSCGHSASGGRAFSRPRAASTQGTEKASGWPSRTGLAQPSCPEDTAGPLNRGGHSPEGFAGSAQVLPGNHLVMPCPHPRS